MAFDKGYHLLSINAFSLMRLNLPRRCRLLMQEDVASRHGQNGDKKSVAHAVAGVSRLGMAAAAATKIAVLSVGSHGDNSALNTCLKKLHQLGGLSKVSTFKA